MANQATPAFRLGSVFVGIACLAVSYLYQHTDVLTLLSAKTFSPEYHFIVNRVFRILLNDVGMVMIIYAIFSDRGVVRLALIIQLLDLLVLFPLYLAFKLPTEGVSELSSPFLSQFHRLIVNPVLMILLIPAILYQKISTRK